MAATTDEPKKKRKQNVACDSCKLRRVKCDLTTLLSPSDPSSSTAPSLPDLVRANPNVECTNCKNKDIKCTTVQILNPTRPNKAGRRIVEARRRFGGEDGDSEEGDLPPTGGPEQGSGPLPQAEDGGFDWRTIAGLDRPLDGLPNMEGRTEIPQLESLPDYMFDQHPARSSYEPHSQPPQQSFAQSTLDSPFPISLDPSVYLQSAQSSFEAHIAPKTDSANNSNSSRSSQSPPEASVYSLDENGSLQHKLFGVDAQAQGVWEHTWSHRQSASNAIQRPGGPALPSLSAAHDSLEGHRPPSSAPTPYPESDVRFDGGLQAFILKSANRNVSRATSVASSSAIQNAATGLSKPPSTHEALSPYPSSSRSTTSQDLVPGRKRLRVDERSVSPLAEDPWRIFPEEEDTAMVRWSRRDVVQQNLADRTLGNAMSKHLVKTYFQCIHPSFPALSPEGFYLEWERAGQQSDRMTLAQEALCAVMEAWGARYSDNPVVLGLGPSRAHTAPKVIMPNGTLAPGTQARAHWGRSRLGVCNALADRARRLIDYNGVLRTPTVTGLQTLILYNQLLHLSDQKSRATGQFMESQMVHATVIEQMKILQLMWDSTGHIPAEEGELPVTMGQMRMKQRRMFWTVVVSDAFNAAASGELPKIPDEEVEAVADWLSAVEAKLPTSTFKTLAFFMRCYHRLTVVGRTVGRKLTYPNKRPGTVNVYDFCSTVRQCWAELKSVAKDVVVVTTDLLESCQHSLLGFSPLNYVSNLRMSCPFMLLVIHQVIREQLDFRKNLRESYIIEENSSSSNSPPGPEESNLAMLDELHKQSVDVLLHSCRSHVMMYKTMLPTGMMQTASIFLRVLIATAQFLAEVPTVEQGYPSATLGGYGWTWETKQREVGICVESLYQLGWAWADVAEVLDSVMVALERMQPTPECLAAYSHPHTDAEEELERVTKQNDEDQRRVLDGAMKFWPPESVPTLIEAAMQELRLENGERSTLNITSRSIPWEALEDVHTDKSMRSQPQSQQAKKVTPNTPYEKVSAKLFKYGNPDADLALVTGIDFTNSRLAPTPGNIEEEYGRPPRPGSAAGNAGHGSGYATPTSTPPYHKPSVTPFPENHGLKVPSGWMDGFNYSQTSKGQWSVSGIVPQSDGQRQSQFLARKSTPTPAATASTTALGSDSQTNDNGVHSAFLGPTADATGSSLGSDFLSSGRNTSSTNPTGIQNTQTSQVDSTLPPDWTSSPTMADWWSFQANSNIDINHSGDAFVHALGGDGLGSEGLGLVGSEVAELEKLLMDYENQASG